MNYLKHFILFALIATISCTKKKPDPAPSVPTTSTTGTTTNTTSSSSTTTSGTTTSGSTTYTNNNQASFSDGTTSTIASIIVAEKDLNTGHITITMIKTANEFPTAYISIAKPVGVGTYKDDNSTNTFAQLKATITDTYTSDIAKGGTCTITLTELTSNKIAGSFTFIGKNSAAVTKTITGSFNCPYNAK